MSSLTDSDKRYFEKLFDMQSGGISDYSKHDFSKLFERHNIDIHAPKYQSYGTSRAKQMRAFWEKDSDNLVGSILSEMLDVYETNCKINQKPTNQPVLEEARRIVSRLTGKSETAKPSQADEEFLHKNFTLPNIQNLPIEESVKPIIENRITEVFCVLKAGAYLSVILLCGSVLEAVLLGAALQEPERFRQAKVSLNKPFEKWRLAELIDVACEIDILKPDVKEFSHGLRDFRNYIHPYQQVKSDFNPDKHTAKICLQVLKAALASVAGERK